MPDTRMGESMGSIVGASRGGASRRTRDTCASWDSQRGARPLALLRSGPLALRGDCDFDNKTVTDDCS